MMTVLDPARKQPQSKMAERQKAGDSKKPSPDPTMDSDVMKGFANQMSRMPDMNIVEPFSSSSGSEDIKPEGIPLSESELPPMPKSKYVPRNRAAQKQSTKDTTSPSESKTNKETNKEELSCDK